MSTNVLIRNNVSVIGAGPQTMILSHGFGTDQTAWHFQVAAFAPHYRLVLLDHVGAGGSDLHAFSPQDYRSLQNYADDLLEVCAALDLHDAVYVGHSMGGMVGVLAALAAPHHFSKLITLGASPRYLNDVEYFGGFEQADVDQLYLAMATNYQAWTSNFAPLVMGNLDRPDLAAVFAQTLAALRPSIALAVAKVIFQSDYRAELPRLQVPTLILQPDHDIVVPHQVGQYLAQHIPHGHLRTINARGHLPHVSAPHTVNEAIAAYLA